MGMYAILSISDAVSDANIYEYNGKSQIFTKAV